MKKLALLLVFVPIVLLIGSVKPTEQQYTGEINLLGNAGFENGLDDWDQSAGSFTRESSEVYLGTTSASLDFSATAQTLDSEPVTVPKGLEGKLCTIEFNYKGGDDNLKFGAWDGSAYVGETKTLEASTAWRWISNTFICPTSSDIGVRIEATADAAQVYLDQFFMGVHDIKTTIDPRWPSYSESDIDASGTYNVTNFVVADAVLQPYQGSEGEWFLYISLMANHDSDSAYELVIAGVSYKTGQTASIATNGSSLGAGARVYTNGNTNRISVVYGSAQTVTRLTGTVPLNSKPTFANKVAPDVYLAGMPDTDALGGDWKDYTPSLTSSGTNPTLGTTTIVGKYRRDGDQMEVSVAVSISADFSAGSGSYYFSIPSGFTPDLTKMMYRRTTTYWANGSGFALDNSAGATETTRIVYTPFWDTGGSGIVLFGDGTGDLGATTMGGWATSDTISFTARIPISTWTTKQYLANAITGFNTATETRAGLLSAEGSGDITFSTPTSLVNITSTSDITFLETTYNRIGNLVFVDLLIGVDPTASGGWSFRLPDSDFPNFGKAVEVSAVTNRNGNTDLTTNWGSMNSGTYAGEVVFAGSQTTGSGAGYRFQFWYEGK